MNTKEGYSKLKKDNTSVLLAGGGDTTLNSSSIPYTTTLTVKAALDEIMGKLYPLECSWSYSGNGTYETGVSAGLTLTATPTKHGVAINPSSLTWNIIYGGSITPTDNNNTRTYSIGTSTNNLSLLVSVSDGTTTITSPYLGTAHYLYRYYGEVNLNVTTASDLTSALSSLTKELSTSKSLSLRTISLNKNLVLITSGGLPSAYNKLGDLSGCITGTMSVKRVNSSTTDTMYYIIVPGKSNATVDNVGLK